MPLQFIPPILDLAQSLFGFLDKLSEAKQVEKERISEFLGKVADCLEQIVKSVTVGEPAKESYAELNVYMDSLMQILKGVVDQEVLDKYSKTLNEAAITEGIAAEVNRDSEEKKQGLQKISEAAGAFRGLSNVLAAQG